MKRFVAIIISLSFTACAPLQTPRETGVAVSLLLNEIQVAINEIDRKTGATSLPPFKKAVLTLSTKKSDSVGGDVSLVVSGEKSRASTDSNLITLVLEPNKKSRKSGVQSKGQEIADYVLAAVKAIDKNQFLELKALTIESGLEVVQIEGGGIDVELVGLSFSGSKTSTIKNKNTLTLIFGSNDK